MKTSRTYEPGRPAEMAERHWRKLLTLTDDKRGRVLERASLLHEYVPGMSWEEADERALLEEAGVATQRELGT